MPATIIAVSIMIDCFLLPIWKWALPWSPRLAAGEGSLSASSRRMIASARGRHHKT
jgi:hypothetical protein